LPPARPNWRSPLSEALSQSKGLAHPVRDPRLSEAGLRREFVGLHQPGRKALHLDQMERRAEALEAVDQFAQRSTCALPFGTR
jgi:hypothetical protein